MKKPTDKPKLLQRRRVQALNPDDVLTPAEAEKVRHGMKQIRQGRFKLCKT
jgi:hypothetical protein